MSGDKDLERLKKLRLEIDSLDKIILQTLAKRFRVVEMIGKLKAKKALPVIQKKRRAELLRERQKQGLKLGLGARFVRGIYEMVHAESVMTQEKAVKKVSRRLPKRGMK